MGPGPALRALPGKSALPNNGPAGNRTEEPRLQASCPRLSATLHTVPGILPRGPDTILLCSPSGEGGTHVLLLSIDQVSGGPLNTFQTLLLILTARRVSVLPISQMGNLTLKKGKTACSRPHG